MAAPRRAPLLLEITRVSVSYAGEARKRICNQRASRQTNENSDRVNRISSPCIHYRCAWTSWDKNLPFFLFFFPFDLDRTKPRLLDRDTRIEREQNAQVLKSREKDLKISVLFHEKQSSRIIYAQTKFVALSRSIWTTQPFSHFRGARSNLAPRNYEAKRSACARAICHRSASAQIFAPISF